MIPPRILSVLTGLALSALAAGCGGDLAATEIEDNPDVEAQGLIGEPSGYPACTGLGWTDPASDQRAWVGLRGTFSRLGVAPGKELSRLTVTEEPSPLNQFKPPYLRVAGGMLQTGRISPLPSNPAIGPAFIFEDERREFRDSYWALRVMRSPATGRILRLCLQFSTPFMLSRVGF